MTNLSSLMLAFFLSIFLLLSSVQGLIIESRLGLSPGFEGGKAIIDGQDMGSRAGNLSDSAIAGIVVGVVFAVLGIIAACIKANE
ncbi:hypothetical protein PM082_007148 [Marasmius tenuissimus]|nr:hypothetical protein PM082_007148 [Marasmius tenuissimus]